MNVLFYSPVNFRCRDLESLAHRFALRGDRVYFLTQCNRGPMHDEMRKNGVETHWSFRKRNILSETIRLIAFCYQRKIDVLYSHLEPTNFISVLAQNVVFAQVIIFRHHINEAKLYGFDKSLSYKLTYKLARHIIVVSNEGKNYMIEEEKVNQTKIHHINLGYDFGNIDSVNINKVNHIRKKNCADVLMVFVGRLTSYKRPILSVDLLSRIRSLGVNAKLLILGKGEEYDHLMRYAESHNLIEFISFEGFVENTFDYLAASDILVHPSLLESSCVVVKEAALVGLPVMVCKNVGDFNSYLKDDYNGFLLEGDDFTNRGVEIIKRLLDDRVHFKKIGQRLKNEIIERFSIENTFKEHLKVIKGIVQDE